MKYSWEKVSNCECLFVHRVKGLFLSVYVDYIKMDGKKQNNNPMWTVLNKKLIWEKQHLSLMPYILDCTQRQYEISKDIVDNYKIMFESRISAGATEKLPCSKNVRISSWSMTWKVMQRSVWNDIVSWLALLKSTRQLGCVIQDMESPKSSSILRKSSNIWKPIRCVRFTKAVLRHAHIRDQNPTLGMICPSDPYQRNSNAPKFEDRSHEETERQERCAREAKLGTLPETFTSSKRTTKLHSTHPQKNAGCLNKRAGRMVDSGTRMHMVSNKELNHAELETMRTLRSPTTVMMAKGEVKKQQKTSKNWTYSWRLCFLKKLQQFFLSGSSVRIMGEHTTGPETTSRQKGQENWLQYIQLCTIRSPWFVYEVLYDAHTYFIIFITGFPTYWKQIHRKASILKKWK